MSDSKEMCQHKTEMVLESADYCDVKEKYIITDSDCQDCRFRTEPKPEVCNDRMRKLMGLLRIMKDDDGRDAWHYFQEGLISKSKMLSLLERIITKAQGV